MLSGCHNETRHTACAVVIEQQAGVTVSEFAQYLVDVRIVTHSEFTPPRAGQIG